MNSAEYETPLRVSERPLEMLLSQGHISEEQLVDKRTIVLANGLSDAVERINNLSKDTFCVGVDPVYAYLGHSYQEFLNNIHALGMTERGLNEKRYEEFCQSAKEGRYIAGAGERLPYGDGLSD